MEESIDDKIKRLKAELAMAKQAHQLWDMLLEKREKLEEKIASLKNELEDEKLKQYEKTQRPHKDAKVSADKEKTLESIKQNKQTIDNKLDDYEDISGDIVVYLQNQLVFSILKKFPDQELSYQNLDRQLYKSLEISEKYHLLHTSVYDIDRLINKILDERTKSKPLRILQYFFGKNPNLTITQNIQAIKILCGHSLDQLHDAAELVKDNQKAQSCLEQLSELLVQLQTFSQNRWSYSKIDKNLLPLKDALKGYVEQLLAFKKESEEDISSQRDMIDLWIEQHT